MLLLAAGRGQRFGGDRPKVYVECAGRTLLRRSLDRLAAVHEPREIILAAHPEDRVRFLDGEMDALRAAGLDAVVDGGATRQESMRRALAAADPAAELVLVHDAARPFFPVAAARRAIERAAAVGAALLAIPAPDTLKRVDDDHRILETVDRSGIWLAQTPQVLRRELLIRALDEAERIDYQGTDDVSLLERMGATVEVVAGAATNLKITQPEDIELATLIAQREDAT